MKSLLFVCATLLLACGGDPERSALVSPATTAEAGGGPGSSVMSLIEVTHSGGQALPHRIQASFGQGVVEIRGLNVLREFASANNPVFPTPALPAGAVLANGRPGSHFIAISFSQAIDPASIFALPASTGLSRAVSLTERDPATGIERLVSARILVGGWTAVDGSQGPELQRWLVADDETGGVLALTPEANGFPDVNRARRQSLVQPRTMVLIADTDDDLSTLETFPAAGTLQLRITDDVRGTQGQVLEKTAFVTMNVGADTVPPALGLDAVGQFAVTPADGATNVDPNTEIMVRYSEPIQPGRLGVIRGADIPLLSSALSIRFGPANQVTEVPFEHEPISPFDLSTYRIFPAFTLPGTGPGGAPTAFSTVELTFHLDETPDLADLVGSGPVGTSFSVGEGAGLVNAPVLPDAVLAIRNAPGSGSDGLSVLDLNGFGASTGSPVSSPNFPLEGESRYPFNPNVRFQPGLLPPPGVTTVDGGSAGAFTLTRDSSLHDVLASSAVATSMADAHIGHALDTVFQNSPPPFGCQSGGGNVCAFDGLKVIAYQTSANAVVSPMPANQFGSLNPGYENLITWAPQPNPPPIAFPPLCASPYLASSEPVGNLGVPVTNLLIPGDPLGDLATQTPPSGLASLVQNSYFEGPSPDLANPSLCEPYMMRQQIGHHVYVADRAANEVVVLNSNRMTVIERIPVADPFSFAMSSNVDLLAVTSPLTDTVFLIDINPLSSQFHEVIRNVAVGDSPQGAAWSPENEDLLVCNEGDGTVSVISASSLSVRRTVTVPDGEPFDVVMAPREVGFGLDRAVYYGYILSRTGRVAVFESGPNGVNGWGFDDVIGTLPFVFQAPKAIQLNPAEDFTAFIVAHEGPFDPVTGQPGALGDGALSTVAVTSGAQGVQLLAGMSQPQFRSITFEVVESLGASTGELSGVPTDLAFDEMWNLGAIPAPQSIFSAGSALPANGKGTYRRLFLPAATPALLPNFLLAAIPGAGVIDVVSINAAGTPRVDVNIYEPGTQSVAAPGVRRLVTYWKQ